MVLEENPKPISRWWVVAVLVVYTGTCFTVAACVPSASTSLAVQLTPDEALTDTQVGAPDRKVPRTPYGWQKKPKGKPPRCGAKEREIFGACYRRAHPEDYSPPCEAPTLEHEGTCYYAVQEPPPPPPTSMEP